MMVPSLVFALLLATWAAGSPPARTDSRVEQWIGALGSPDPRTRAEASASLVAHGEAAVPELIDAMNDWYYLSYEAYSTLLQSGARAVPGLVDCLWRKPEGSRAWRYCPGILVMIGEPALKELRRAAAGPDPLLRKRAAETLAGIETPERTFTPELRQALRSPEPAVRNAAINSPVIHDTRNGGAAAVAAMPLLIEALEDSDHENRLVAAGVLGDIGPAAIPAIPALSRLYDRAGDDPEMRSMVAWALAEMAAVTPEALALLKRCLHDDEDEVRYMAASTIRQLGPRAAPLTGALIDALAISKVMTRVEIVQALGDIYEEADPVPALREALSHRSVYVRFGVAQLVRYEEGGVELALPAMIEGLGLPNALDRKDALKELDFLLVVDQPKLTSGDSNSAVRSLLYIIESDDEAARKIARNVVSRIGPTHSGSVPVLAEALSSNSSEVRLVAAQRLVNAGSAAAAAEPALTLLASDPDPKVRIEAVRALAAGTTGLQRVRAITPWLRDSNEDVRATAALGLNRGGPATASAAPELVRLLDDSSSTVRAHAATALKNIGPARLVVPALAIHLDDADHRAGEAISSALASYAEAAPFVALAMMSEHSGTSSRATHAARSLLCTSEEAAVVASQAEALIAKREDRAQVVSELAGVALVALRELSAALDTMSSEARRQTMRFLVRIQIPSEATPTIRKLLGHSDETVRVYAAAMLRRIGEPGWEALAYEVTHGSVSTRQTAAFGLARTLAVSGIDDARRDNLATVAVPALSDALDDTDSEVRRAAAASIGSFDADGAESRPRLVALLADRHRQVRVAAGLALRKIDAFGLSSLELALRNADPAIRGGAAEALGCLYQNARSSADALREACRDDDPRVSMEAAVALNKAGRDVYHAGRAERPKPRLHPAVSVRNGAAMSRSVDVILVLDESGRVEDAWIVRGDSAINDVALAALTQWSYTPATIDGVPVAVMLRETIAVATE